MVESATPTTSPTSACSHEEGREKEGERGRGGGERGRGGERGGGGGEEGGEERGRGGGGGERGRGRKLIIHHSKNH